MGYIKKGAFTALEINYYYNLNAWSTLLSILVRIDVWQII